MATFPQKSSEMRSRETELLDQLGINREHLTDHTGYEFDGSFLKVQTEYVWAIEEMTKDQRLALSALMAASRV
jgi:hypothetical protein